MHQMHMIRWLIRDVGLEGLDQRHLDGHPFTKGTLLGGLINNSIRDGLKKQLVASGS